MRAVRRGSRREEGASLVEFALVAPLLLIILFGIIEFGLAFRDKLTIGNSTQSAARVGSAVGQDPDADLFVLQSLEQSLSTLPNSGVGVVNRVQIFKATANGGIDSGQVNTYFYVFDPVGCDWVPCPDNTNLGYASWTWAPDDRNVEVGNLDIMGVRVHYAHNWLTGSLLPLPDAACNNGSPPTNCFADTALMRMEPQSFGVSGP